MMVLIWGSMRPHAAAYSVRPELYGITCAEAHVTHTIQGQIIPTTTYDLSDTNYIRPDSGSRK